MKDKYKVAVVGMGKRGMHHATAFQANGRFEVAAVPQSDPEMQRLLDHGDVDAAVRVMPGFARDVLRGRPAQVQVLVQLDLIERWAVVRNAESSAIAWTPIQIITPDLPGEIPVPALEI